MATSIVCGTSSGQPAGGATVERAPADRRGPMADKVAFIHGAAFAAAVPTFTAVAAAAEQVPAVEVQPRVADGIVFSGGAAVPVPRSSPCPLWSVAAGCRRSPSRSSTRRLRRRLRGRWPSLSSGSGSSIPELAASIATIGERDGLPRDGLGVPVAPSDALSDTRALRERREPGGDVAAAAVPGTDRPPRRRDRALPDPARAEPAGHALAVTLEPYPAPELASAAVTAGILHHELAIVLRYSLGGSGIEKEVAFPDLVTEGTLLTATATLASLPEADGVSTSP